MQHGKIARSLEAAFPATVRRERDDFGRLSPFQPLAAVTGGLAASYNTRGLSSL
jgi:hypothetical protein